MVRIANTHKEVVEHLEKDVSINEETDFFLEKFDAFAQEYNDKAKVKRIPHLITSTELVINKIHEGVSLDDDDLALLNMMQRCKDKSQKKKDKAHHYYVNKKEKVKDPSKKRVRETIIDKAEDQLTEEEKAYNKKVLQKQELNLKRKKGDTESRARDKFFTNVMKTYIPDISNFMEELEKKEDEEVEE